MVQLAALIGSCSHYSANVSQLANFKLQTKLHQLILTDVSHRTENAIDSFDSAQSGASTVYGCPLLYGDGSGRVLFGEHSKNDVK